MKPTSLHRELLDRVLWNNTTLNIQSGKESFRSVSWAEKTQKKGEKLVAFIMAKKIMTD